MFYRFEGIAGNKQDIWVTFDCTTQLVFLIEIVKSGARNPHEKRLRCSPKVECKTQFQSLIESNTAAVKHTVLCS
ncbi:hypothetical protein L596_024349 [Steinernema carpocapsae]|uniref:Uncharacterized protein n=1 Tax=Steinernema carpocapsae TaxID=34508 RepID=A0A4U5MGH9_STECR|nr:hypothetical protein L596_024349 [Steinernema carpocapsae]